MLQKEQAYANDAELGGEREPHPVIMSYPDDGDHHINSNAEESSFLPQLSFLKPRRPILRTTTRMSRDGSIIIESAGRTRRVSRKRNAPLIDDEPSTASTFPTEEKTGTGTGTGTDELSTSRQGGCGSFARSILIDGGGFPSTPTRSPTAHHAVSEDFLGRSFRLHSPSFPNVGDVHPPKEQMFSSLSSPIISTPPTKRDSDPVAPSPLWHGTGTPTSKGEVSNMTRCSFAASTKPPVLASRPHVIPSGDRKYPDCNPSVSTRYEPQEAPRPLERSPRSRCDEEGSTGKSLPRHREGGAMTSLGGLPPPTQIFPPPRFGRQVSIRKEEGGTTSLLGGIAPPPPPQIFPPPIFCRQVTLPPEESAASCTSRAGPNFSSSSALGSFFGPTKERRGTEEPTLMLEDFEFRGGGAVHSPSPSYAQSRGDAVVCPGIFSTVGKSHHADDDSNVRAERGDCTAAVGYEECPLPIDAGDSDDSFSSEEAPLHGHPRTISLGRVGSAPRHSSSANDRGEGNRASSTGRHGATTPPRSPTIGTMTTTATATSLLTPSRGDGVESMLAIFDSLRAHADEAGSVTSDISDGPDGDDDDDDDDDEFFLELPSSSRAAMGGGEMCPSHLPPNRRRRLDDEQIGT